MVHYVEEAIPEQLLVNPPDMLDLANLHIHAGNSQLQLAADPPTCLTLAAAFIFAAM